MSSSKPTAALKQAENPTWMADREHRLQALPSAARALWYEMNGREATGEEIRHVDFTVAYQQRFERMALAIRKFDELASAERRKILRTLFPKLGDAMEDAWQLQLGTPYQVGYTRQGFRAPKRPELGGTARATWLRSLTSLVERYDQDLVWFAQWAAQLAPEWSGSMLGVLFAGAIDRDDAKGREVFAILKASAEGTHPTAQMGRHVTRAFLMCGREEAWVLVEKLLLAAQRQEGLRQSILEALDEAHPQAYRRILQVILAHNLERFSAVVRAFDVWLALRWDSAAGGVVRGGLETLREMLVDPAAREAALAGREAERLYFALYAIGTEDVDRLDDVVTPLLRHSAVEIRHVTAWLLLRTGIIPLIARVAELHADADVRVRMLAVAAMSTDDLSRHGPPADRFTWLKGIFEALPEKKITGKPIVWPWNTTTLARSVVADALRHNRGTHSWDEVLPFVDWMEPYARSQIVQEIQEEKEPTPAIRRALLQLAGDASGMVRESALKALATLMPEASELRHLESLLTRQATDLRRGVLELLLNQPDAAALESARRLLASKSEPQNLGGLELLRLLKDGARAVSEVEAIAQAWRGERTALSTEAEKYLGALVNDSSPVPSLEAGLGLYDPAKRAPVPVLPSTHEDIVSPEAIRLIISLDDEVHRHRETPVRFQRWSHGGEMVDHLLGECTHLPYWDEKQSVEENLKRLPLTEVWQAWWRNLATTLSSAPEKELVRASMMLAGTMGRFRYFSDPEGKAAEGFGWNGQDWSRHFLPHPTTLRYAPIVRQILDFLVNAFASASEGPYVLAAAEMLMHEIATARPTAGVFVDWWFGSKGEQHPAVTFLGAADAHFARHHAVWPEADILRLWRLHQWLLRPDLPEADSPASSDEATPAVRIRPELALLLEAHRLSEATPADIFDALIGPRHAHSLAPYRLPGNYDELSELTRISAPRTWARYPEALEIADRIRRRAVEIETNRGDSPSLVTPLIKSILAVIGVDSFARILESVERMPLQRGWTTDSLSRKQSLSHLLLVCVPAPEDTPERVGPKLRALGIKDERLIEAAVYAPQWARHIEVALGWPGFESSVWWLHAHTKDAQWSVEHEIREQWTAQIAERTPLTAEELLNGAVDVAWFRSCQAQLTAKRWAALDEASRYASSGSGHKRAQLFADAMLGNLSETELLERVMKKRYQDAVRALGLLPLVEKPRAREEQILRRYQALQEFVRASRQFGAQRQASEKLASQLGQENLARTAGYRDPMRLQWAMEVLAVRDLGSGALTAQAGDIVVTLQVDELGGVELSATKKGKALKALPPAAKKVPAVEALLERKAALTRQRTALRRSLEEMMCRREALTGSELQLLMTHPIAAPLLGHLVLANDGVLGYPRQGGKVLEDFAGRGEPVAAKDSLRIAHPHDLWKSDRWSEWQRECFGTGRVQPFKQVFRELYPLTETERRDPDRTRRFAGQQVNPTQAIALLGQRGWVARPEAGVGKTFHHQDVTAWLTFEETFYTPAEVEGLTLEGVWFTQRTKSESIPTDVVDPVLFSEVMRDVDLIVSVAHRGGVDPEASASTVEMRANLLRETVTVLQLDNVRFKERHVVIEGQHATYTVHLGSGVAHLLPGGMLFVVAVHAQHRGRLFLPFADDDPKTAEVMSKVLLLARDGEIKDPSVLEQIRARAR